MRKKKARTLRAPGLFVAAELGLVDVVLLPVERGVGLDDDVLVRVLLKLIDEHGFARLQSLGDFRVHAQREVRAFVVGHGHFAGLGLDFVAERGDGLDHAGSGAVRARLAEHAFERLLSALARDADEPELVERERLGRSLVLFKSLLQRGQNFFAVAALLHVDEVHDNDAAEVAQPNLPDNLLHGFEVSLDDGVLEPRGAFADELAGVDVDGHQRFGVVDDDVAAGLQPDLRAQSLVQLVLDAELFEDRRFLGVQLDLAHQLRLETADELDDLAVLLFAVNPDGSEIVADVIAEHALDEIEIAMEQGGRLALLATLLDFVPGLAEEVDVGANFVIGGAASSGAHDESAGIAVARFADQTAKPRTVFRGDDFARDAGVMNRGHVDQEATRQSDMAGDARAFFAERLLGDLDDHVLTGLQHLGNELRTARRAGTPALIASVLPRTAAGTAFETRAAWASATIGTSATTVRSSSAVVAATIPATAAEGPLETRTRVAADARGTARELFAWGAGTADARRAGFTWKKDHVFFDDRSSHDSFARSGGNHFLFDVLRFDGCGFCVLFIVFLLVLGFGLLMFAKAGGMDGAVVREICFGFGAVDGALFFDIFRFFRGELRVFLCADGFRLAGFFFGVFFFELGAADDGIGFRFFLGLFVFGLDEARSKRRHLIFVQFDVTTHRFGFEGRVLSGGSFLDRGRSLTHWCRFRFGPAIGQEPARKAAREPARNAAAWSSRGYVTRRS